MDPEMNCVRCGWRPMGGLDALSGTCPKCGGVFTVASDESTIPWAPRGEPLPNADDAEQETEFLIGEASAPESSDIGKRTTVQDLSAITAGEGGPPGSDIGVGLIDAPAAPVASDLPFRLLDGSTPSVESLEARSAPVPGPSPMPPVNAGHGLSPLTVKLLVSYASAITLACLYLLYMVWKGAPSLDLPDLAPPATKANRVTTLLYVPPDQVVPEAYRLRLGESQRYGSLRVTPLRVTRGPLSFAYFNPEVAESRSDSGPVLKLHLQLENVSADQEFIPIDRQLVYTKEPDKRRFGVFKANNFLCNVADRSDLDRHVLVYDLAPDSSWIVREENLDRPLNAGETVEVFVPSTEDGLDDLKGDLVWRVHLRKGYNRRSLRGVTTLVEIFFRSSDIVDETSAAPGGDV